MVEPTIGPGNGSLVFLLGGVVAQPLLAVKEKQHRQECLCYYACRPLWGSKTAVVAPQSIGAVRPPSTMMSRGAEQQVRAICSYSKHFARKGLSR
jgi:hypothetical protein